MNEVLIKLQRYILMILVILPFLAKGQIFNDPFLNIETDSINHSRILEVGGKYNLGSNALTNRQINSLFVPGFIGDDIKNSALPYLKLKNNDLGAILNGNLFYSWQPANCKSHYFINISSQIQYTATFSADAYKLVMFGNSIFAGKTADFGDLNFTHYAYQSLQIGFYNMINKSEDNLILFGGGISLVSGSGYNNLSITKGALYTSASGDSLSLNTYLSSRSVNTTNMITAVNGLGASANGFIALKFAKTNEIRFQIADLGFIDWFRNTHSIDINREFNYTGENVRVINGKTSVTQYYLTLDTIASQAGHPATSGSFVSGLPFQIRMIYTRDLNSSLSISSGIEYIHDNMGLPEVDLSIKKVLLNKRFSFRAGLTLFGYSNYGISAGLEYSVNRKCSISIGSQHLDGMIFPNETLGQGYFVNLKIKI